VPESPADARERMIAGAADMIRRRGLNATSVRELAKYAGAPLGSTYHYFPGGKQQLAAEAVRWAGGLATTVLTEALRAGPVAGLETFLDFWRSILLDTDFRAGCPVLAVSVEDTADEETAPREAAAQVFRDWTAAYTAALREHGANEAEARRTATLIIAAIEGAGAMCRAERSIEPLEQTTAQLHVLIRMVTTAPRPGGTSADGEFR
jgi:AcrR family transcriptional regulator